MWKKFEFHEDPMVTIDGRQFFGHLFNEPKGFIDSGILSAEHKYKLFIVCGFADQDKYSCIYRASDDGRNEEDYLTKCDNMQK